MMILLSLLVKSHMYDILLLVYQDAATQEFLFQFHRKDLIFLIRLSPIYTRSKASFNVRTNLLLLSYFFKTTIETIFHFQNRAWKSLFFKVSITPLPLHIHIFLKFWIFFFKIYYVFVSCRVSSTRNTKLS